MPAASPEKKVSKDLPILPDWVKKTNQKDALFMKVCKYLANFIEYNQSIIYLCGSWAENGLLYKNNKLWVNNNLRLGVIQEVHGQPAMGHAGVRKTVLLIQ